MDRHVSEEELYELSALAGVPLKREVFEAVLELVKMDVVPTALHQVLKTISGIPAKSVKP